MSSPADSSEALPAAAQSTVAQRDGTATAATTQDVSSAAVTSSASATPVKILARPAVSHAASTTPTPAPIASTSTLSSTIGDSQAGSSTASPPKDKNVTLLRRSSSTGAAVPPSAGSAATGETSSVSAPTPSPRSSSEGRGQATSRAAGDSSYRRTGSESALASRAVIAAEDERSDGVITPRSSTSSPVPSTSGTDKSAAGGLEGEDTAGDGTDDGAVPPPPELDSVLLLALAHPRDRILLLRAEVEIERFLASPTLHRLPLSPPYFPPALNSYQRLLIHRLADTFGITREVDAIPPQPAWAGAVVSQMNSGVVVLVKGEGARLPSRKLASYVPSPPTATTPTSAAPPPSPVACSVPPTALPISVATTPSALPSPTDASSSPVSPVVPAPAPQQPQIFKILPRASSHRPSSSASSSVGTDEDGKGAKGRRELTLEEREAAYKEARERIWAQQPEERREAPSDLGIARPSSAGSNYSRSSAAMSVSGARASPSEASSNISMHSNFQGPTVYYPPSSVSANGRMGGGQHGGLGLRPSAPSFDPSGGGGAAWMGYGYAGQEYEQGYAYEAHYAQAGDEWSRRQPGRPAASTSTYPYAQQPPIQVTAPPPPPPNQPPYPAPSSLQYPPLIRPSDSYSAPPPHSAVPNAWSTRAPALPSPALSTSSGGSSYHQLHQPQQHPHPHPPPPNRSSSNGSVASTSGSTGGGAGYLMRFPDGGVVGFNPSPASSVSESASAAYAASSTSSTGYSAAGSARSLSTGSASTSRTASSSNLRGPASSVGTGGGEGSAAPAVRRTSHSTSHSLSSSSVTSGSAGVSEAGSSGKRTGSDKRSASGSERGGASTSSGKGKERDKDSTAVDGQATIKKSTIPLHPSLPAKPVWVTKQPPAERTTSTSSSSTAAVVDVATPERRPPSVTSSVSSSSYGLPGTVHVRPPPVHTSACSTSPAGSTTYVGPPSPHYPPPQAYYHGPPPPPGQAWPVGGEGYYGGLPPSLAGPHHHPQAIPPTPQQYHSLLMHDTHPHWPPASMAPPPSMPLQDPIMQGPEIRRPPPRSTALFDYSKPSTVASGGKRTGSTGRSGVRASSEGVAEVERAVEGMRL